MKHVIDQTSAPKSPGYSYSWKASQGSGGDVLDIVRPIPRFGMGLLRLNYYCKRVGLTSVIDPVICFSLNIFLL